MEKALKQIKSEIEKKIDKSLSTVFMFGLGKTIANGLMTRTRLGKGTDGEGMRQQALKKLSTNYKKQRKKDREKGVLFSLTTPAKSNLTRTGQLLNAITSSVTGRIVKIFFKENRNDGKKNIKIAGYQEDQDRPFFYISKPEKTNISRIVRKRINDVMGKG